MRVRQPLVELVLAILHYLANHPKERLPQPDPDWMGATRYDMRKHLPGTQHDAIVGDAIDRLLQLNYVKERAGSGVAKYYRITDAGMDYYTSHGKGFLDFARKIRKGGAEEPVGSLC